MFVDPLAERNLFVSCTSGMCNRLLLLAGAMRIAEETNRKLFFRWSTNGEAGGTFNDLFTNPIAPLTEAELLAMLKNDRHIVVYNQGQGDELHFRAMRRHRDTGAAVVIIKGWDTPLFQGETESDVAPAVLRHLRSLNPVREVLDVVRKFALPYKAIGVHVRRADHVDWFGDSRDEDFIAIMRAVLIREPKTKFFFSTDSDSTQVFFHAQFGKALVWHPKSWASRASVQGVREALIDVLLLSRTSAIIGNSNSTFSMMAARYGGKPLVVANQRSVAAIEETMQTLFPTPETSRVWRQRIEQILPTYPGG